MRLYRVRYDDSDQRVQRWARTRLQVADLKRRAWEHYGVEESDVQVALVEFELSRRGVVDLLNESADIW